MSADAFNASLQNGITGPLYDTGCSASCGGKRKLPKNYKKILSHLRIPTVSMVNYDTPNGNVRSDQAILFPYTLWSLGGKSVTTGFATAHHMLT